MNATLRNFIIIALVSSIIIAIAWLIFKKLRKNKDEKNIQAIKGGKNNPGHLRYTINRWKGKIYPEPGTTFKFESFDTLENGIRAWLINARTQINKGYNTIEKFIDRLTPANENPESARKAMKDEIRKILGREILYVKDLYKIAPIIFKWEGNPDYLANRSNYNEDRIKLIQINNNIVKH